MCYKLFNAGYSRMFWPIFLFEHPNAVLITSTYCRSSIYEARGVTEHSVQLQPPSAIFLMCMVAHLGCCTPRTCPGLTKSNLLLICRTLTVSCNMFHTTLPSAGISWSLWLPAHVFGCLLRTLQHLPGTSDREVSLGTGALAQYCRFPKEMTALRDLPTQTSARRYFLPTQLKSAGDETVTG